MELLALEHIAAVATVAAVATAAAWAARRRRGRWPAGFARGLALAIAAAYVVEHLAYAARGDWRITLNLPLHLTDVVTATAVVALLHPRPLPVELTYFWGFTASLLALLTPEIARGFPDVYFFTYFATHGGAVVAAALLVPGLGLAPRPGCVRRAFLATAAVAAAAAVADVVTGGNYMYLRAKPAVASPLDLMGPWPVYIAVAAAVAIALFGALYAPFARRGRDRASHGGAASRNSPPPP